MGIVSILFVAGLFEIGWAVGLKYTEGFTRLWPSVWTVAAMAVSLGTPGAGAEIAAARYGLRGVDRDWRGRHGAAWHLFPRRFG